MTKQCVPTSMRLLYYLMISDENLPDKDREAARAMLKTAVTLKQDLLSQSNIRDTILNLLEVVNEEPIDRDTLSVLLSHDE